LGLRRGEACGFQWRDVDWEYRTIHVVRQVQRVPNPDRPGKTHLAYVPLKTAESDRVLPLADELYEDLRGWYEALQPLPDSPIVSIRAGRPVDPDALTRWLTDLGRQLNGGRSTSPHKLRHSAGMRLQRAGVPLGATTRYAAVAPEPHVAAAQVLSAGIVARLTAGPAIAHTGQHLGHRYPVAIIGRRSDRRRGEKWSMSWTFSARSEGFEPPTF
jgi:integrase